MPKLKSNADQFLWPSVILLLGLSLTGMAGYRAVADDDKKSLEIFTLHAQDASRDIRNRVEVYFGVLRSAGSFFAGSEQVTRAEWSAYVDFLMPKKYYPGIEGMGVIRYVQPDQKKEFEDTVRRENVRNYTIHPSGMRGTYYPVEYFWPSLEHINPLGLDHGAYPAALKALEAARDSGLATITRRLHYAQDGNHNPPILFLYPIYQKGLLPATVEGRRKAIYGFIYSRVDVEELFHDAISSSITHEIYLEVFDGSDADRKTVSLDKSRLVYDADPSDIPHALDSSYKPRHHVVGKVAMDSATWLFYTASRPGGMVERRDSLPLVILLAGSFLSLSVSTIAFLRNRQSRLTNRYAYYDSLTDLPNRRLLHDRLQQALANAKRHGTRMALLFLDLDNFKPVNDGLGHEAGDKVLKVVSSRLASCLRKDDTLSRVGGDEFVVLLLDIPSEEDVSNVAQKIIATTSAPISINGRNLHVGCSIGISIFPDNGMDDDALMRNADDAMYRAKEDGRGKFMFCVSVEAPARRA